jgi:hypothetical protein
VRLYETGSWAVGARTPKELAFDLKTGKFSLKFSSEFGEFARALLRNCLTNACDLRRYPRKRMHVVTSGE